MSLTSQLLHSVEIVWYDYQTNSLSLPPPSQKAHYHFQSFNKLSCNSPNSCRVQTDVLQWTYSKRIRICISISGNAWFAKFLAWLNGWTAHFIGLCISNSSLRSVWWQNDRCEKASSHLLPLRFQQWCRSERLYLARDSSQEADGMDKSPALSSCSPVIKNSSALFGNILTVCCETVPCTKVTAPPFWQTVRITAYAKLLFSLGVLHSTAQGRKPKPSGVCLYFSMLWG